MNIYATFVSLALIASLGWSLNAHNQLNNTRQAFSEARLKTESNADLIASLREECEKERTKAKKLGDLFQDQLTRIEAHVTRSVSLKEELNESQELLNTYTQLCLAAADVMEGKKNPALGKPLAENLRKMIAFRENVDSVSTVNGARRWAGDMP